MEIKNGISVPTTEKDLKLTKKLNTDGFNVGMVAGLPFKDFPEYDDFWKNEDNYKDRRDLWNVISIIRSCFIELFKWEGVSKKESRLIEEILFRSGKVAIVKLPDGEVFISAYTDQNKNGQKYLQDQYGYPKKIRIISPTSIFDGRVFENTEDNKTFAVVFNNTYKFGTLWLVWERIRAYLESLERLDVINRTSDVKVMIGDTSDDMIYKDLNEMWYSLSPFLKVASQDLRSAIKNGVIELASNASTKMELNIFHLNNLLTMLGFREADLSNKAERQTELEVANNDKFGGMILKYMLSIRQEASEIIKEDLGLSIVIIEHDYLKNDIIEKEQEEGLNGEENKNNERK